MLRYGLDKKKHNKKYSGYIELFSIVVKPSPTGQF
jgi:hypothetical protein